MKSVSEFRAGIPPSVAPPPSRRWQNDAPLPSRRMQVTVKVLRIAAAMMSFVAAIVMGTAAQTKRVVVIDDSGSPVTLSGTAKSHYSSALVYFIVINVLSLAYSLAVLMLNAFKKEVMASIDLPLTVADLLTMIFLVSCNGAASAISVVAQNGNRHFGWDKICESVGGYCAQVAAAIVISMFGMAAYVVLALLTLIGLHKGL
ncbi:CASP-like protein [Platanthera zijinensis]|uniref:CASP-like protein n=1 Tax=Platanthera zijinensis TaxID=2320716 RepID=A0AAP0B3J5_9ASPA